MPVVGCSVTPVPVKYTLYAKGPMLSNGTLNCPWLQAVGVTSGAVEQPVTVVTVRASASVVVVKVVTVVLIKEKIVSQGNAYTQTDITSRNRIEAGGNSHCSRLAGCRGVIADIWQNIA